MAVFIAVADIFLAFFAAGFCTGGVSAGCVCAVGSDGCFFVTFVFGLLFATGVFAVVPEFAVPLVRVAPLTIWVAGDFRAPPLPAVFVFVVSFFFPFAFSAAGAFVPFADPADPFAALAFFTEGEGGAAFRAPPAFFSVGFTADFFAPAVVFAAGAAFRAPPAFFSVGFTADFFAPAVAFTAGAAFFDALRGDVAFPLAAVFFAPPFAVAFVAVFAVPFFAAGFTVAFAARLFPPVSFTPFFDGAAFFAVFVPAAGEAAFFDVAPFFTAIAYLRPLLIISEGNYDVVSSTRSRAMR